MSNIYQPPGSDVIGDSSEGSGVRYGLLALILFVGFPLFQLIAWVFVPIANRIGADLVLNVIDANRESLILVFDLLIMSILYWFICVFSVTATKVNAWVFCSIFGIASGVVILAEKGWVLIAPEYAFPIWYELGSVFLGLVVSVASAIYLYRRVAA